MPEKPQPIEFHHVPYGQHDFEYEPIGDVADLFKHADYVKPDAIKRYIKQIAEALEKSKDKEVQKACIMDLLREENIQKLLDVKLTAETSEEKSEIEKMTFYWIREIRKKIIAELKKYLPDDLYFFVKNTIKSNPGHFNIRTNIVDSKTGKVSFLKESNFNDPDTKDMVKRNLEKLRNALNSLENPQQEMPFVIHPDLIGHTFKHRPNDAQISFTTETIDLENVDKIFFDEQIEGGKTEYQPKEAVKEQARIGLNAIIDCLRGAKFLAEHGMTMTDINTDLIGKNLGINKKTKRGILFDLDGIRRVGESGYPIIGPIEGIDLFPPEYHPQLRGEYNISATAPAMIWEFGATIYRLAEQQEELLYKSNNFFSKHNLISLWDKLKEFANQMKSEKIEDRPSFDICIAKLEEIINKYLPQTA